LNEPVGIQHQPCGYAHSIGVSQIGLPSKQCAPKWYTEKIADTWKELKLRWLERKVSTMEPDRVSPSSFLFQTDLKSDWGPGHAFAAFRYWRQRSRAGTDEHEGASSSVRCAERSDEWLPEDCSTIRGTSPVRRSLWG
jgi:hypothetical protein